MEKIHGVNLGNWLVLEKWMDVRLFEGTGADDEIWLSRKLDRETLHKKIKAHRDSFITEQDFANIAAHGVNLVRIPVPYFIFGDREPLPGGIDYVDLAFQWAKKYGLKILLDLHTVPGSQNGYDNGGLTGVCKWSKSPDEVEFALSVLERLALRYGQEEALYGIQPVNEPISFIVWVSSPSFGKAVDKAEAKGSSYVSMKFLRSFYLEAYKRLRAILPEDKVIVFHDGFRIKRWKSFFTKNELKNVMLDTHIYIFAMEGFLPISVLPVYRAYVAMNRRSIRSVSRYVPVVVGEWCISNKYAGNSKAEEMQARYRQVADLQLQAWSESAGFIYWSYKLWPEPDLPMDDAWKEAWDLNRDWARGYMPTNFRTLE